MMKNILFFGLVGLVAIDLTACSTINLKENATVAAAITAATDLVKDAVKIPDLAALSGKGKVDAAATPLSQGQNVASQPGGVTISPPIRGVAHVSAKPVEASTDAQERGGSARWMADGGSAFKLVATTIGKGMLGVDLLNFKLENEDEIAVHHARGNIGCAIGDSANPNGACESIGITVDRSADKILFADTKLYGLNGSVYTLNGSLDYSAGLGKPLPVASESAGQIMAGATDEEIMVQCEKMRKASLAGEPVAFGGFKKSHVDLPDKLDQCKFELKNEAKCRKDLEEFVRNKPGIIERMHALDKAMQPGYKQKLLPFEDIKMRACTDDLNGFSRSYLIGGTIHMGGSSRLRAM